MDYVAQSMKETSLVAVPAWRSLPSSVSNDRFLYANTSEYSGGGGVEESEICTLGVVV